MKAGLGIGTLAFGVVLSGMAWAQTSGDNAADLKKVVHPVNRGEPLPYAPPTGTTGQQTPPITWHGGPVMSGAPAIHLIWYGNWNQSNGSDNPAGQGIVDDFVTGLSGSDYMYTNTGYTGSGSSRVTGVLGSVDQTNFGYLQSRGRNVTSLSDANIKTVVSNYISSHGGAQANAVYFVLTSSDVNESSGFCSQYCGWHTHATISGVDVKYSFVGNANRCLSSCAIQTVSPNANAGVDGMVSVIGHELSETVSDEDLNAWYDSKGAENGDKCAWTFGHSQVQLPSGAYYNVTLPAAGGGSRNFLIQRMLAATSICYIDGLTQTQ